MRTIDEIIKLILQGKDDEITPEEKIFAELELDKTREQIDETDEFIKNLQLIEG